MERLHLRYDIETGMTGDVPLDLIVSHVDPVRFPPWVGMEERPLDRVQILVFLAAKAFETQPFEWTTWERMAAEWPPERHLRRIAYLMSQDVLEPIEIEVTDRGLILNDGHHRLAASIIDGRAAIAVGFHGFLDRIGATLNAEISEAEHETILFT